MSAQLDFPPIAESAPALTVAAPAQPAAADLAKIDLQAVALAQFGDWRKDVDAAKKKLTDVVLDLATQSKVDEAKSLRHRTVNTPIAEVRKVSKALKSKLAGVSKAIGAEEEAAVVAWTAVGELLTPQIDARQAQLDEERAVKAQGEAIRKALHMALIERIKGYVEQATGLPSERIGAGVTFVQGLTFGDECQEFLPQYRAAHAAALAALIAMRDDAKGREDAEAQRLENERVAAELAAQKQALEDQAAELLRQRAAITHAAVFSFPEPEPIEIPEAQPTQQVLKATPAMADATDRVSAVTASPVGGPMGAQGQPTAVGPAGGSLVATNNAARAAIAADATPATAVVWINTATLSERLGVPINGALAEELGHPGTRRTGPGLFWPETKVRPIGQALIERISSRIGEAVAA